MGFIPKYHSEERFIVVLGNWPIGRILRLWIGILYLGIHEISKSSGPNASSITTFLSFIDALYHPENRITFPTQTCCTLSELLAPSSLPKNFKPTDPSENRTPPSFITHHTQPLHHIYHITIHSTPQPANNGLAFDALSGLFPF